MHKMRNIQHTRLGFITLAMLSRLSRLSVQDPVQQLDGLDCPFRQASEAQLVEVLQLCSLDRDAAADSVAAVLEQGNHKQDTRQQLRVTFTTLALSFAQQRQFSAAKCGVVFNITQALLASVCRGDSREECEAGVSSPYPAGAQY